MGFLHDLKKQAAVEGAAVVNAESLADLQGGILDQIFEVASVLRRVDPPQLGTAADDHIAYLFDRCAATHVMQV